ncbi:4'-phosphopantetheinyl transferase family protein [Massilia sp. S19_KUP03_FR1]|uniref:4'-phosphopantetheinyl transferase family protein n=1 Tax=Massilia sp. S19_KUP03_FR1 TaxID=3025503 RepID=UPI002FCDBED3
MNTPCLPDDELHVWWWPGAAPPAAALAWLTAGERARHARFLVEADRDAFLAAHAMLRMLLDHYGCAAARQPFATAVHGKPGVTGGPYFNLSHTRGLVACAFSRSAEVGVDVEHGARTNDWQRLLDQVHAPEECAALRALPEAEQQRRFYQSWTRKEAWAKVGGEGLHLDFRTLNVLRPPPSLFLASFDVAAGFEAAVACARAPSRLLVRRFDWARALL